MNLTNSMIDCLFGVDLDVQVGISIDELRWIRVVDYGTNATHRRLLKRFSFSSGTEAWSHPANGSEPLSPRWAESITRYTLTPVAIFGILLAIDGVSIGRKKEEFAIFYRDLPDPIQCGPKHQAGTTMCRAFLKIQNIINQKDQQWQKSP